ncbi:unnamed protein product [Ranitomeya imitator]|uniref:Long-chain-fatty-acid--CoA ligase n=1 Tax=Ranitomeya imitator TaxID=111125 RepID=A0ABN9L4G3_9NEOB|nr:unnamed protein product [Ranitomeya imitator]
MQDLVDKSSLKRLRIPADEEVQVMGEDGMVPFLVVGSRESLRNICMLREYRMAYLREVEQLRLERLQVNKQLPERQRGALEPGSPQAEVNRGYRGKEKSCSPKKDNRRDQRPRENQRWSDGRARNSDSSVSSGLSDLSGRSCSRRDDKGSSLSKDVMERDDECRRNGSITGSDLERRFDCQGRLRGVSSRFRTSAKPHGFRQRGEDVKTEATGIQMALQPSMVLLHIGLDEMPHELRELKSAVEDVLPALTEDGVMVFYLGRDSPTEGVSSLLDKVEAASVAPLPESYRSSSTVKTPAVYIYTSGTTGLPKAALINQGRLLLSSSISTLAGISGNDVLYIPLPLYHSAGLMIGVRGCIQQGATCVLRNKFSASQFWDDCRKYNVTAFQYIGEILRYLCNTPKKDNDKDHRVRFAVGNGLRQDVWREFINRFGNIHIYEFYAATEGNSFFFSTTLEK